MAAYAALAAGLINLRYQNNHTSNLAKSLVLILPGALLLGLSLTAIGKSWLNSKAATIVVSIAGGLLLVYSFLV
jgi:lysozyme family protein